MKITFDYYTSAQLCMDAMEDVDWFGKLYSCDKCRHDLGMVGFFCIECVLWKEVR